MIEPNAVNAFAWLGKYVQTSGSNIHTTKFLRSGLGKSVWAREYRDWWNESCFYFRNFWFSNSTVMVAPLPLPGLLMLSLPLLASTKILQ